jgi:hypothetical protein
VQVWEVTLFCYRFFANFTFLTGGGNGPYYALRQQSASNYSLFYVLAILHHPLFEAMINSGSVHVRGNYSSRGKQFIADLPIRMIDSEKKSDCERHGRIVALVQQCIAVTDNLSQAKIPGAKKTLKRQSDLLKRQINQLIEELYEIGEGDMQLIEDLRQTSEPADSSEEGQLS